MDFTTETDFPSATTPDLNYNSTDLFSSNSSFSDVVNSTMSTPLANKGRMFGVLIKVVYAIGIIGNAAAIIALRRGERRVRNRKHLLLLTSLAANDLVALVGMMCAMVVADHVPGVKEHKAYCGARVLLRTFGIGSVCIAVTMALERYLALTRPFLYQKQVTYYVIRMALLASWCWAAALTCAPVLGLGLYYDERRRICVRYREATSATDFGYAVFYVLFGTLLCVVLVYCNLAVIRALYAITSPRGAAPLVRRVSKTTCRLRPRTLPHARDAGDAPMHHNAATAEEVAFSRLMATLSVLFMICWLPQMVTSALYLSLGSAQQARLTPLAHLSDVLMLLNYVLDPVLYVLMRRRKPLAALCHSIASCFKRRMNVEEVKVVCLERASDDGMYLGMPRPLTRSKYASHKTSTESVSMKTSCCAPETLVVSDSSPEGRPLRLAAAAPPEGSLLKIED